MEERYLSLTVISDPVATDHACCMLEEAGIPVVIQHLVIPDPNLDTPTLIPSLTNALASAALITGDSNSGSSLDTFEGRSALGTGYRLLVPMRLAQTAMRLLKLREPVFITPRTNNRGPDLAA
jgi:hypothetical protein